LLTLHDRLLGEPLQFGTYGWPINRGGQPYGGGGVYVLPRDFMKLGQSCSTAACGTANAFSMLTSRSARARRCTT
jgi:hypothetical protein